MTDVRILRMRDGYFIPQVKVKHFLWGHHWDGLYVKDGEIWQTNSDTVQLDKCKVGYKLAQEILRKYTSRKLDLKRLQEDDNCHKQGMSYE